MIVHNNLKVFKLFVIIITKIHLGERKTKILALKNYRIIHSLNHLRRNNTNIIG
jgi:hypothetical protein